MNKSLVSRLAAAVLLALPLAHWMVGDEHAKAVRLASPSALTDYIMDLQQQSFGESFFGLLVMGVMFVLAIEVVSYVLRKLWDAGAAVAKRSPAVDGAVS